MKNLKKVLAMVLAFACTFTMFASAKMYEDVQPGTEFSEAITMLSDLGIIQGKTDNKYHPEDTITRAEACALIARLMTGDPNAAGFNGAHHFKDVPAGHWASSAIGYAVVNGIAVGVDEAGTRFEPNRPIKDKEFVTMIVRALGYETPDMRQNFPFSYMSAANAIGLLQDVTMVPDTDALRGEDAQVIYNAMFVDYARGAKRVNVAHGTSVESYPTLAESVWHLNRAALGTWNKKDNEDVTLSNCKAHTWVILGEAQDEENALLALAIDDNDDSKLYEAKDAKTQQKYKAYKFKYEGSADIDALRGYKVELWGAGKHGEPVWEKDGEKFVYSTDWKIKAIKTVKNQTKFDYNPSMADRKSKDGSIELNEETKLSLGSAADNAQLVKQEQGVKEVVTFAADVLNTIKVKDGDTLEEALNVRNGMQYKLIDWNNDKEIDWVVVDEARYYKVESATSKRVVVSSMEGDNLKSDKDSKVETWKLDGSEKIGKNLEGKDVKIKYEAPEGLKEGDIVEVTYKVAYDGAQVITATVKVVDADNQKLEKVATKDGLTLTFGDKELKVAQNARKDGGDVIVPANPEKYAGFNGEELGTEFALYKNRNDFIVYSDYATEASNYMMVLNTFGGKDTTGNRDLAVIDFVDANNTEHKDVKVSSSARVLDKDGKTLSTNHNDAYANRKFDEAQVVGNVFKYWTDADGVITKMQAMFTSKDAEPDIAKESYKYDADADRLIDKDRKYVASLEDAKVIFAVKEDYIKADNNGSVFATDLKVDSRDVLATKQKDIPDISMNSGDTTDKELLLDNIPDKNTWLGAKKDNDNHFVVNLNKNYEATAAILGVDSFNKFNAGQTKLALVTNISETSAGVVEAEAAYDGKVETISSIEKQKFEDIVKVFDGEEDNDVSRADSTISTKHGNGVFDGGKLSTLVNEGGQYAEISMDKDGKLTKIVFMDDDKNNHNLLRGHHYEVSRNLILDVKDKNLRYGLNDNATYHDVVADQRFASDDKLFSTGRLEAASKGYEDEAKFYEISANPSRHDKDYTGTRLTVNAGFDDLDQRDIKAVEKGDIDYNAPDYRSDKNHYEIADLASKIGGDLVGVYSFKSMDEQVVNKNTNETLVGIDLNKTTVRADENIEVQASILHTEGKAVITGFKVFDDKGRDVSTQFECTIKSGYTDTNATATVKAKPGVMNGEYTIKVANGNVVYDAGRVITVTDSATKLVVNTVKFAKPSGNTYDANNKFYPVDKSSFVLEVNGVAEKLRASDLTAIVGLEKENITVTLDGQLKEVTQVQYKGNGFYVVTLADVDFTTTPDNNRLIVVELNDKNGNINMPKAGMNELSTNTNGQSVATGGDKKDESTEHADSIPGVGNVYTVEDATGTVPTVDPVDTIKVVAKAKNGTTVIKELAAKDFTVMIGQDPVEVESVAETPVGTYAVKLKNQDLRGKTVTVTVNGKSCTITVPKAKVVVTLGKNTLNAKVGEAATENTTVTPKNANKADLKIWEEGGNYTDNGVAELTNLGQTGVKLALDTNADPATLTLSQQPTKNGTAKVCVGVSNTDFETLTVNVAAQADGIEIASAGKFTVNAFENISNKNADITLKGSIVADQLIISSGNSAQGTATTAEDTTTGVTAKIVDNGSGGKKIELSGTPKKAGTSTFTVGSKDGKQATATVTVTISQATIAEGALKADNGAQTITITVGDDTKATALVEELKAARAASKLTFKYGTAADGADAVNVADDAAIVKSGNDVKITTDKTFNTGDSKKLWGGWSGLTSFADLTITNGVTPS